MENSPARSNPGTKQEPETAIVNDRVKELMSDLLHMRKRLKKEEESRRTFQEMARKKDEELKKIRSDIT